jgi:hypothetical protein
MSTAKSMANGLRPFANIWGILQAIWIFTHILKNSHAAMSLNGQSSKQKMILPLEQKNVVGEGHSPSPKQICLGGMCPCSHCHTIFVTKAL